MRRTFTRKAVAALAVVMMGIGMASCSGDDEPVLKADIKDVHATFTYTVPDTLFRYVDITVCYNNNDGTDAICNPMIEDTYTVNYDLDKFPITAPFIVVFDKSNRLVSGIKVDNWPLEMDIHVDAVVNGKPVSKDFDMVYELNGDLFAEITKIQNHVQSRTYAIVVGADGDITFRD